MENNTEIILENEIKKLNEDLIAVEDIEKVNQKISTLKFEQNKEDCRKSYKIRIELKQAYLDGYRKAIDDANVAGEVKDGK